MFCPVCKNEFRPGITVCPDCNKELVEELLKSDDDNFVTLAEIPYKELSERIVSYMKSIGISVYTEEKKVEDSPEGTLYSLIVSKADKHRAAGELKAVMNVEAENFKKNLEENKEPVEETMKNLLGPEAVQEAEEESSKPAGEYVKAKDRKADYKSSGITFLVFGALLLVIILLNLLGVMTYFETTFSRITVTAMGAVCVIIGVLSLIHSKKMSAAVSDEESLENKVMAYLRENFTKEKLDALGDSQDELLFFKQMDVVKASVHEAFPEIKSDMAESICDDFLEELFN